MKGDARDTLTLPFEKGLLDLPAGTPGGLFLNARPLNTHNLNWQNLLTCEQGQRADFVALGSANFKVYPSLKDAGFECALVLCGKHKRLNEMNLVRASAATREGGMIVVAGDKTAGIAPLRKFVSKFCEIEGSLSKHHAVVFWFRNPEKTGVLGIEPHQSLEGFETAPGMFSPDNIDAGSKLLATFLEKRIGGNVADFGAGWGYLSREILEKGRTLHHLDLYESDWASLEAAKLNVTSETTRLGFHWHDLLSEPVTRSYDWIIMNPPFHSDRPAEPAIGQTFIKVASRALRKGGRLLMVANRNLPYENALTTGFSSHQRLSEDQGFKVIQAIR